MFILCNVWVGIGMASDVCVFVLCYIYFGPSLSLRVCVFFGGPAICHM